LVVLAQGKLKERALRELVDDYKGRLGRYLTGLEEIEVKDAESLARRVPRECCLVMLEVWGEALSSPRLAAKLETWSANKNGNVCFVIGVPRGFRGSFRVAVMRT
jgi:23S rRNA pseudoU1915 N3-methylase RlmH